MKNLLERLNSNYYYSPIQYHDSWISVDPIIGCQLNCQYCYMQMTNWTGVKPQLVYSIPQIFDLLINYKYFIPHKTVLCFGTQTDSFLPDNVPYTLEFFKLLEEHQLRNPVAVVTKKLIPEDFLDEISNLKYTRPIFCLSYSGLPREVEKGVNPEENRQNFKNLSERQLRRIHFWRPLLTVNGTTEVLQTVLDLVAQYSMASVYIGLKLNPSLYPIYQKNPYLKIPQSLAKSYGDYIPEGLEERLRSLASVKHPNYPLYKHTSCAVSLTLSIPDYNATLYRDPICKGSECPIWKRNICENARSIPSRETVKSLLDKLSIECDFKITQYAVEIFEEINQEDYVFLLHQLNFPLVVKDINYHLNLRGSIFRKDEKFVMN